MPFDLARIDAFLESLDSATDDNDLRRLFRRYSAEFERDLPKDPFSSAYRDHQFGLYERLHGKPYATNHEVTPFDVATAAVAPFPYSTRSPETVGNQLIAIGFMIRTLGLSAGSRVLEFGPGWGNTTIALAKMGCHITAVDIEPRFVELLRERASMERITSIDARVGDFSIIETIAETEEPYDALLFFECFHHCSDHLRLIQAFDRVVRPGGQVCFGAEPINDDFPIPWGLRMDGESLWAIRRHGWLELGFNRSYFDVALARAGWGVSRHALADSPWAHALIAHRLKEPVATWRYGNGALYHQIGEVVTDAAAGGIIGVRNKGAAGYLMHGPYRSLDAGRWRLRLVPLASDEHACGKAVLDASTQSGKKVLACRSVDLSLLNSDVEVELDIALDAAVDDFEVRLECDVGCSVAVTGVDVFRVPS